jgi:hypothetical protein
MEFCETLLRGENQSTGAKDNVHWMLALSSIQA